MGKEEGVEWSRVEWSREEVGVKKKKDKKASCSVI